MTIEQRLTNGPVYGPFTAEETATLDRMWEDDLLIVILPKVGVHTLGYRKKLSSMLFPTPQS